MQQQDKITKAAIQLENMAERKDKQSREVTFLSLVADSSHSS
jgi:hypothetical protein